MVVVQNASEPEPTHKRHARWSQEDNAVIIDLLKSHQSEGHQSDSGWKGVVWTTCEAALRGSEKQSGGGPKTANGCKEHWLSVRLLLEEPAVVRPPIPSNDTVRFGKGPQVHHTPRSRDRRDSTILVGWQNPPDVHLQRHVHQLHYLPSH